MSDDRFWVGPASAPDTYQLVSCLGGGAEGEVWTAVLPLSAGGRRNVAVKIIPPGDDEDAWVRHGHLLRSLSHPGLVRVLEVFTGPPKHRGGAVPAGAARYVIMDLIEGVTLREWLDENATATASQRLRPLVTVAAALDEMHSGTQTAVPVAHGDVKPSNIVMRADGSTVLVDLGLTRLADGAGRVGRSRPYAAPELFQPGAHTTPEADRFAFAATVVHAILGEPPPVSADGGPDLAAVASRLATNAVSARRPILVQRVMEVLSAPPAHRPANLRGWLGSLTDTLSQLTESAGGQASMPAPVPVELTATSAPGIAAPPLSPAAPMSPAPHPAVASPAAHAAAMAAGPPTAPMSPIAPLSPAVPMSPGPHPAGPQPLAGAPMSPAPHPAGPQSPAAAPAGMPLWPTPPAPVPAAPAGSGGKGRRLVVALAIATVVAVAAGGGVVAYAFSGGNSNAGRTSGPQNPAAATTAGAAATTGAAPTATQSADPLSGAPAASGSASAGPSGSADPVNGPAPGTNLATDEARRSGFIAMSDSVYARQDVAINGKTSLNAFQTTYGCCSTATRQAYVDINLSRGYKKFTGRGGVEDHSKANEAAHIQVFADNRMIYDHAFMLGQSDDLSLDVTGVMRLRIVFTGPLYDVQTAVGEPLVYA